MPLSIHQKNIEERIKWLWNLASEHSRQYQSAESYLNRTRYLAAHPTVLIAFKCMDGRIHLPYITQTPLGIIQPFRNLGGAFNLGWPYLGEMVSNSVMRAVNKGRRVLILVTYHFSRGKAERGCAGFAYDTGAAMQASYEFKRQMERVFGSSHETVAPIVVGVETDEDALIFHNDDADMLDLSSFGAAEGQDSALMLRHALDALYTQMPGDMLNDLMPLALGNMAHIAEVRNMHRTLDMEHHEWVLCVGRGFDFLHVPNTALIVGPYGPNVAGSVVTAANIIKSNMQEGRVPDDGMVLLASAPYEESGSDQRRAIEKARFLSDFAAGAIKREVPYIHERMRQRTCVLNWATRQLMDI